MESLRFDASGKNGGPRFEGDRRDRQAHFVESTCIVELPGQVSTANNPDAALASGGRNVVEVVVDCTANYPHVEAIRNGKVSRGEHERGAVGVARTPLVRMLVEPLVGVDPLVGCGTHHQGADAVEERAEGVVFRLVDYEESVERVVVVRDEAGEGGGGVVDHVSHASTLTPTTDVDAYRASFWSDSATD